MKVMKQLKLLALGLFISQAAFAGMPPKPAACPSVSALQAVGVNAYESGDLPNTWDVGVKANNYQTKDMWTFAFLNIPAQSAEAAMKLAQHALLSLASATKPVSSGLGVWDCVYRNDDGFWTMAVTPVSDMKKAGALA